MKYEPKYLGWALVALCVMLQSVLLFNTGRELGELRQRDKARADLSRNVIEVIENGEHRTTPFDRTTPSVVALHCVAVAVVIQAKATGLGPLEQLAIAEAIMTRSDMGEEGGHPCDIVLAPGQFLGVESFPPPRVPVYEDRDAWFLAQQVTLAAMKGDMRTPCHGATHYFEVADAPADKLRNACVLDKLAFIRIE